MNVEEKSWDKWFDLQYELQREFKRTIEERTKGMSSNFRAAVYCGIIETMCEEMRVAMELPASDGENHSEENFVDSDCPLHATKDPGLEGVPQVLELGGAVGRTSTSACRQGQHDLCLGECYCRCHE